MALSFLHQTKCIRGSMCKRLEPIITDIPFSRQIAQNLFSNGEVTVTADFNLSWTGNLILAGLPEVGGIFQYPMPQRIWPIVNNRFSDQGIVVSQHVPMAQDGGKALWLLIDPSSPEEQFAYAYVSLSETFQRGAIGPLSMWVQVAMFVPQLQEVYWAPGKRSIKP